MRLKKKASLEISIQAIVIVVLAMTLLGLGLVFIRNQFETIGKATDVVTGQVADQIKRQMLDNDQKIALSEANINIKKGGSVVLNVGVNNKNNDPLNYEMEFIAISDQTGTSISPNAFDIWFRIGKGRLLGSADQEVRSINIQIPRNTQSGTYQFTFNLIDVDNARSVYATEDVFIKVLG